MKVKYNDLEMAYYFVSSDGSIDNCALLDKSTGNIYWRSDDFDEQEIPEEMWEDENTVAIPGKYDLDLGKRLVMDFTYTHLDQEHYDHVREIFSRRGAYSRFKGFLDSIGQLDNWFTFEQQSLENALREWAKENGVEIAEE